MTDIQRQDLNARAFPGARPPMKRSAALQVLAQLGAVYALKTPGGLVKIGHSGGLQRRLKSMEGGATNDFEIIGFRFGTRRDEHAIHASLKQSLHHGREWYYPTPEVLAVVNEWRAELGCDPITA